MADRPREHDFSCVMLIYDSWQMCVCRKIPENFFNVYNFIASILTNLNAVLQCKARIMCDEVSYTGRDIEHYYELDGFIAGINRSDPLRISLSFIYIFWIGGSFLVSS